MSRAKSERLVNLTLALMAADRLVTVEEVARLVEGYRPPRGDVTDAAFRRMFERDKEELRALGIPIETGPVDPLYGDEIGYRIRRSDYALPPLSLDADEAAALGLAARFWTSAELADASASALRKLSAGGVEPAPVATGFETRVDVAEPSFGPLTAAVRARQAVGFGYRRPDGVEGVRRLQPWGVASRSAHWYVAGHDLDRDAPRVFRLSRLTTAVTTIGEPGGYEIPPGADLRAAVSAAAGPEQSRTARLRATGTAAVRLARQRAAVPQWVPEREPELALAPQIGEMAADEMAVSYDSEQWFAQELASYGPDVVVLAPETLRAEVIRILQAAAA